MNAYESDRSGRHESWGPTPHQPPSPPSPPSVPDTPPYTVDANGQAHALDSAAGSGDGAEETAGATRRGARGLRRPTALLAAVAVAAAMVGGGTAVGVQHLLEDGGQSTAAAPAVGTSAAASNGVGEIAEAVRPGVVEIKAAASGGTSTGSGVVITGDGELLTNNHVVAGADTAKVSFSDGRTETAEVVGHDADHDLALLRAKGDGDYHPVELGDSDQLGVGDQVVAIGSPEGLTGTVTSGIVSAKDRKVTVPKDSEEEQPDQGEWPFEFGGGEYNGGVDSENTTYRAIQTDASLNPGNSGGALVDMSGKVVGINSAMYSASSSQSQTGESSSGSIGLGFAIPVNDVQDLLKDLRGQG